MHESGVLANISASKYRYSMAIGQFLSLKDMLKLVISACSKNSQKNASWGVNLLNETLAMCFAIIFQDNAPMLYQQGRTLQNEFLKGFYKTGFFKFVQELEMLQKRQWDALKVYDAVGDNSLIILNVLSQQQRTLQISDIAPHEQITSLARSMYAILLAPKQTDSLVVSLNPLLEMLSDESKFLEALETLNVLLHQLDMTDIEAQYHDVVALLLDKIRTIEHLNCSSFCTEYRLLNSLNAIFLKFKTTEHQLWFIEHLIGLLKNLNRKLRRPVLRALARWATQLDESGVQFIVDQVSELFDSDDLAFLCDILEDLRHDMVDVPIHHIDKKSLGVLLITPLDPTLNAAITDYFLFRLNQPDSLDQYHRTGHAILSFTPQLHTPWLLEWVVGTFNNPKSQSLRCDTALDILKQLIQTVDKNDELQCMAELLLKHIEMPHSWIANKDLSMMCQLIDKVEPTSAKKYTDRVFALISDPPPSAQFVPWGVVKSITGLISKFEMEDVLLWIKRLAIHINPTDCNTKTYVKYFLKQWIATLSVTDRQRLVQHIIVMQNDSRSLVRCYALDMLKHVINHPEKVPMNVLEWVPLLLTRLNERDHDVSAAAEEVFFASIKQFETAMLVHGLLLILNHVEGNYRALDRLFRVLDSIIVRRSQLNVLEVQKVSEFLLKQLQSPVIYFNTDIFNYFVAWLPKLDMTAFPPLTDWLLSFFEAATSSSHDAVLDVIKVWIPTFDATENQRLDRSLITIMNRKANNVFITTYFNKILGVLHRMIELNKTKIPIKDILTFVLQQFSCYKKGAIGRQAQALLLLLISKLDTDEVNVLMDTILAQLNHPDLSQRKIALWVTLTMRPLIGQNITPWLTALMKRLNDDLEMKYQDILEVIVAFRPNMREQDAIIAVTQLMSYLDQANADYRKELFNTIKAVVSYHPKYAYPLNDMDASLEKFYLTLMLDMVKKAEILEAQLPKFGQNNPSDDFVLTSTCS